MHIYARNKTEKQESQTDILIIQKHHDPPLLRRSAKRNVTHRINYEGFDSLQKTCRFEITSLCNRITLLSSFHFQSEILVFVGISVLDVLFRRVCNCRVCVRTVVFDETGKMLTTNALNKRTIDSYRNRRFKLKS